MTDYQKGFCEGYDQAIKHGKEPLSSHAVLGKVPSDVEDFIYKVLAVFEFIESGDLKKIGTIKKQANQLIVRYGLDK